MIAAIHRRDAEGAKIAENMKYIISANLRGLCIAHL